MQTLSQHMTQAEETLDQLHELVGKGWYFSTGSSVFNGKGNDLDVVACITNPALHDTLHFDLGFIRSTAGNPSSADGGTSDGRINYRKGNINLITVPNEHDYYCWLSASGACQRLAKAQGGTIQRRDRYALHRMIVDGCSFDQTIAALVDVVNDPAPEL